MTSTIGPCTGGCLTDLLCVGALDKYLSDPNSTCWRTTYVRSSQYASEAAYQPMSTVTAFGGTGQIMLSRQGDLLHNVYLVIDLPAIELRECKHKSQPWVGAHKKSSKDCDQDVFDSYGEDGKSVWRKQNYGASSQAGMDADDIDDEGDEPYCHWANAVGMLICKQVDLLIGGSCVDTLTNTWLWVYSELFQSAGRLSLESTGKRYSRYDLLQDSSQKRRLFTHLPFWFATDPGSSLPIASLCYHSVTMNFQWESLENCIVVHIPKGNKKNYEVVNCSTGQPINNNDLHCELLTQNVYLSQTERERFANSDFDAIVCVHQRQVISSSQKNVSIPLAFNHALIEMMWFAQRKCAKDANCWANFSGVDQRDPIVSSALTLS